MDRLALRFLVPCIALLSLGCPGDDGPAEDGPETAGSSGSAETNSTTEPTATTSTTSTTEPTATNSTTEPTATNSTTDEPTAGDSTGPGIIDCSGVICGEDEFCDWSLNACGTEPSDMGTCMPRPEGCGDIYQPVCGCDGQVHSNICDAQSVGVDVSTLGDCDAPAGYFECGYRYCEPSYEYCQVSVSDVGGFGNGYSCVSPAVPCEPPSCDCLSMEICFEFGCNETRDGGVEIVCPGG